MSNNIGFKDKQKQLGELELGTPFEKIVVVQLVSPSTPAQVSAGMLTEMHRLVETLSGKVVGHLVQRRLAPHPQTCLGSGKVEQLESLCHQLEADTVVVDHKLTPNQISRLEHEVGVHIMDRTELILEIFARRAKTAEARIQVELAYLDYYHPRMNRHHRQRAYRGGVRGGGDSQLGRRLRTAKARSASLRRKLEHLQKQKESQISNRQDQWTVAIVGYTNAGKSSLLKHLSGDQLYADDRLFATLDTTTRRVHLGNRQFALVSDTVGFIRNLPHELVASFHSTLAEAREARLLLHVADAASGDLLAQLDTVQQTLIELDMAEVPVQLVMNKTDLLDSSQRQMLQERFADAVFVSTYTGDGIERLLELIRNHFESNQPAVSAWLEEQTTQSGLSENLNP